METYPRKNVLINQSLRCQKYTNETFLLGLPLFYFFNEIEGRKMTDDHNGTSPRNHRSSSGVPPTIPEEPSSNSTISALVINTPLVEPTAAVNGLSNSSPVRSRRRSSVSILQALVHSNHLIPTRDVRNR
jgi:hypothetical protein